MRFFIDEAGDFAIPTSARDHKVAVGMGMAVSDTTWPELASCFLSFKADLADSEIERGEPKWYRLNPTHRAQFCELVGHTDGISLTPVTLDLSHLALVPPKELVEPIYARMDWNAARMVYKTARSQIELLAKQVRNLSVPQVMRIYSWANCLREALYHSILFLSVGPHRDSWNSVSIEIDPVQPKVGSREQRVFSFMVLAWLVAWSHDRPFATIEGVHTSEHPFVRNYVTEEGVSFGKLVRPNVSWPKSSESDGLQIADLAAAVVYSAASERHDNNGALSYYARLMKGSFYGPVRGPGLFSPVDNVPSEVPDKYRVLTDVMRP